jgi:hypothetical protein
VTSCGRLSTCWRAGVAIVESLLLVGGHGDRGSTRQAWRECRSKPKPMGTSETRAGKTRELEHG